MYNFTIKPGQAITLGGATMYCTRIKRGQVSLSVEAAENLDEPTRATDAINSRAIAKHRLATDITSRNQSEQYHGEPLSQDLMPSQW